MSRGRLSLLVSLAVLSGAAFAAPPSGRGPAPAPVPEPRMMMTDDDGRTHEHSLAEAVRRVERATRGQILSAERVPFDGRDMNRIKVLDSTGRVRVITEDPRAPRPPRDDD